MRINEALGYAAMNGKNVSLIKKELRKRFWPDATLVSRRQNWRNLANGITHKIDPEWVHIMVELTGVDANFLFSVPLMPENGENEVRPANGGQ
jgi:hypothetical protein